MDWKVKLDKFLKDFKYKDDVIGVLACGSYITGNPTSHSDLDVHIILKDKCDYRVKTNKIVDGLIIECFVNPPKQIRTYFKNDYEGFEQASMNQFATGEIVRDDTGVVKELKEEAQELIEKRFKDLTPKFSALDCYGVWDMLDDLQDAYKEKRKDFNFIYFTNLNKILKLVCKSLKYPYGVKTILNAPFSDIIKRKYSLPNFPDAKLSEIIKNAISQKSKKKRLLAFQKLCEHFWQFNGGFDINTFDFKSKVSL